MVAVVIHWCRLGSVTSMTMGRRMLVIRNGGLNYFSSWMVQSSTNLLKID
uniref:Uncharacterized protein n=1 Tax=Picea glauca TaxID=3330 RepID=A0A117NHF2_PICGL|nr:hypothetical protein ABT39_MTgene5212 [Picea glauca]